MENEKNEKADEAGKADEQEKNYCPGPHTAGDVHCCYCSQSFGADFITRFLLTHSKKEDAEEEEPEEDQEPEKDQKPKVSK